jgi:pimeloyl-ACP methyl ester carboxylesterase
VPSGWDATRESYARWLVGALEVVGSPVDLVGHDWGGGHVAAVAISRPDLLRSWCIDGAATLDVDHEWHDLARVWRSPDAEVAVAEMVHLPLPVLAGLLRDAGVPPAASERMASAIDEVMGACIPPLYRSVTVEARADVSRRLSSAASRPGLVVIPSEDRFGGTEAMARGVAERAGARCVVLDGLGHWWMIEDPTRSAEVLSSFWSGVAGGG